MGPVGLGGHGWGQDVCMHDQSPKRANQLRGIIPDWATAASRVAPVICLRRVRVQEDQAADTFAPVRRGPWPTYF